LVIAPAHPIISREDAIVEVPSFELSIFRAIGLWILIPSLLIRLLHERFRPSITTDGASKPYLYLFSLIRPHLSVDPRPAKGALHVMLLVKGVTDCHVPITVGIQRRVMPGGGYPMA
jgi:hypothetical protein